MLKIGIDVYSALHMPRGMGVYTINFIKYLAEIDKENQYILYGDMDDVEGVLPKQENFKLKVLKAKGLFAYGQIVLPKECKKDEIDILHSPANTSPIFLDKKIKRVLTLHDVIVLKKTIPLSKSKKQFLGRLYCILTILLNRKKIDKFLTVSSFSKEDIIKTLKIPSEKIEISNNGHEHFNTKNVSSLDGLNEKFKLPKEYYFHLGGDVPSKNTKFLLNIFAKKLTDKNIIVAGIRELNSSYMYQEFKDYKNIYFVPYISQKDLVGLYKNAKAFIFASLYEGFGIPLLEAMKCNCPIICSNVTCLPEIAGDAALYFNPKDKNELLETIQQLADNDELKKELIQKGKERLNCFSWKQTARKIYEIYNNQ